MSGGMIVGERLRDAAPLTAIVAPANIKLGRLSDNAPHPSLLVRTISTVEQLHLRRGSRVRYIDRISVTCRADTFRDVGTILKLVVRSCAGFTGNIGEATNIAITSAGGGPDLNGPGNSFERAVDFRVTYDAPA